MGTPIKAKYLRVGMKYKSFSFTTKYEEVTHIRECAFDSSMLLVNEHYVPKETYIYIKDGGL